MPSTIPIVLIVGGPDVDARLDLMRFMRNEFYFIAIGSSHELNPCFRKAGFTYHVYPLSRQVNPISDLVTIGYLLKLFRRLQPQIVHTFDTKPAVLGRLAARLANVPIVIGTLPGLGSLYVSNNLRIRLIRSVYQLLQKLACYFSDVTIFQTHGDAQMFIAESIVPKSKAVIIPGSGVRCDLYNPNRVSQIEQKKIRADLGVRDDEIVITMVSRLIRSKGVMEFVKAAKTVRQFNPQVSFLLVGPLDEESVDPLTTAELSELKQTVIWVGKRNDIFNILAVSDIFVLPSFYREGIPRVLLEAASMGLPIVTTNSPGCNEVVEHGVNGFLVPVRDPNALAEAISILVKRLDLRLRFGEESRRRAVANFDLSVIAEQTRAIYRELLTRKRLAPAEGCINGVSTHS